MLPSAQSIIIELGCLNICNRNMRKFVVKYNQMECSCKRTSCLGNKMYYFGLLAFRLIHFDLYAKAALAWIKKKRSLRNEKLKANRASETEQRKERLRMRRENKKTEIMRNSA